MKDSGWLTAVVLFSDRVCLSVCVCVCVLLTGRSSVTKDPELDSLIIMDSGVIEGGLNVTLTIRLLMHGKEVGSIIGKVGLKQCYTGTLQFLST